MSTNGKIVLGFFFGMVLGSVSAYLTAPSSGLRTRKSINKKAKKMVKQIQGLISQQESAPKKRSAVASQRKNGKANVATR